MNKDLTTKFILGVFKEVIVDQANIPSKESFGQKLWDDYGFEVADEFVYKIYEECSLTDDGFALFENDENYSKQLTLLGEIINQIDESAIEASGLDKEYLPLAKKFVEYAYSRMEGGG